MTEKLEELVEPYQEIQVEGDKSKTKSTLTYEEIEDCAKFIKEATNTTAKIAVIAGSSMDTLGLNVTEATTIQYELIPHFPRSESSIGKIIAGNMENTPVLIFKGRYHLYDGYTMQECTMHIKVLKLLGVKVLIIINTSGGINQDYKIGDIMLVKDHINLQGFAGQNPLIGPNDERFGPRFIPMNKVYDKDLLGKAKKILDEIEFEGMIHEGVYATVSGPAYDTISENLFLKTCEIDAVGLTIIPEVLVAKHSGMSIVAFSIITDQEIVDENNDKEFNHEEMIEICDKRTKQLNEFLEKFVKIAVLSKEEGDIECGGDEIITKSSKRIRCKCNNLN
nr:uncharacterized protein LOC111415530 isoform X1 [Onthophagus taurus]